MNKIIISVNPKISQKEWEDYVFKHPEGNVYHLPAWKEVLEESFANYQPFYLFAFDAKKKLSGILPLFQVRSFLTGKRMVSLPFSYVCGPIADSDEIGKILLKEAKKICQKNQSDYLEIRCFNPKNIRWQLSQYYSTYRLLLFQDPNRILQKFDSEIRRKIRKGQKMGARVIQDNSQEGLRTFYRLNLLNKKSLGVPAHPLEFMEKIRQKMAKYYRLYLVKVDNLPIAGGIRFFYKKTALAVYGAADRRYLNFFPNNLRDWQAIVDACQEGYAVFDFGRVPQNDPRQASYKKDWGAKEQKLAYYYPSRPKKLIHERNSFSYHLISQIWKKLPLGAAQLLGENLFKHFD